MAVSQVHKIMNSGNGIPVIGLGTYQYRANRDDDVRVAVNDAVEAGYRHFDCAWIYGNERQVGLGIQDKISEGVIRRDQVFITTKLWNNFHQREKVPQMLKSSLEQLQLTYVDLYLIHWPIGFKETAKLLPLCDTEAYSDTDYLETWRGMEDCVSWGLAKNIGLANFNKDQIERILINCTIPPAINQIELNPMFYQKELLNFCSERGILITAYCPLGINELSGLSAFPEPTVDHTAIEKIGLKHGKTAAQVVLNYLVVNLGVIVVPKTLTKVRIVEHIDIFNFTLDPTDIAVLEACNSEERCLPFGAYLDHPLHPFFN